MYNRLQALRSINRLRIDSFKVPIIILLVVISLIGASIWLLPAFFHRTSASSSRDTNATQSTGPITGVSPLIFGSNLQLSTTHNQVLASASTRSLLQIIHTHIVRIVLSADISDTTLRQAMQVVQGIGATPLIVLRGVTDTHAMEDDMHALDIINVFFARQTIYYEYGNEVDALGVTAEQYTSSWNAIIPSIKQRAPYGRFVGPVTAQYNSAYLATFLQNAHPLPDDVSWHEYTCDRSWIQQLCIAHIANWSTHITNAQQTMQVTIHTKLPIMITEWNYAANAFSGDGKSSNSTFMTTWTTQAFQTLAANHILASMQYTSTNSATPLIGSKDTLTAQGIVFQQEYERLIPQDQTSIAIATARPIIPTATPVIPTPSPASTTQPTPTSKNSPQPIAPVSQPTTPQKPAPVPGTTVNFNFADGGTDGWEQDNGSALSNSRDVAYSGRHSLAFVLNNASDNDYPIVYINTWDAHAQMPGSGQIITAYVYIPSGSIAVQANIFVEDTNNQQHAISYDSMGSLTPGVWNHISYTVPDGISVEEYGIGIHPQASTSQVMAYIDNISW